jgi:vacuolar-type H+-ATPase subunit I/STV1
VTPPSCDGDAIQCGIVQQEWLNRCATTNQADIASAVSLGDGEAVSASTVDQSTALSETGYFSTGVGTCPGGSSLTMFGNTLSYNFLTALCSFALKIQGIVMVVGYLIGISIWVRGLVA